MMVCAHICDFIHRTRTSNRVGIKTGGTAGGLIGKAGRRLILGLSLLKNTDQSHRMAQMQPGLIQRASERWTSPAQSYCESTWSGFKSRFYLLVWIMNLTSHKFSFLIYKLGTFTELWGLKKKKIHVISFPQCLAPDSIQVSYSFPSNPKHQTQVLC